MTDILEEILSDQREASKVYYFKKLLPFVVLLTFMVVIGMLIYGWHNDKQVTTAKQLGDILAKSIYTITDDKTLIVKSLDELAQKNDSKLSELALLQQVNIKVAEQDYLTTRALLEKIIQRKNCSDITASYARLAWLNLAIDNDNRSEQENKQLQEYLQFFKNESQIFFGHANLIKAIWLNKNGQVQLAKDTLKNIISLNKVPSAVKKQAKAMLAAIEYN